ncbi:ATP-binding protein [Cetobacterium sp.]|uniref:ATP-binding protein n=1 Tax=Cetobacterium sp. TaxID=2071632 RepID=UPI0025B8D183|nr:ATP-binding protein [Cetobacterium sp.]
MKIKIKNLGKIEEAKLELENIAVIVGNNNSGKSTIGKGIYTSLATISEDFYDVYNEERKMMINIELRNLLEIVMYEEHMSKKDKYAQNILTSQLFRKEENLITVLKNELSTIRYSEFRLSFDDFGVKIYEILMLIENVLLIQKLTARSEKQIKESSAKIRTALNLKYEDLEFKKRLFKILVSGEFNNPIKKDKNSFSIEIDDFKATYSTNQNVELENINLLRRSIYLDTPFIVNYINNYKVDYSHESQLYRMITENLDTGILEKEKYFKHNEIEKKIEEIIKGKLIFDKEKNKFEFHEKDLGTLGVKDLATGVKSLGILLMLLKKIDYNTVLILDEPEVHLHPEWQFKLAEILTIISKEIGAKILITTHSTFFVEAIELFSKKYEIQKNFYYCQDGKIFDANDSTVYKKVNGEIFDELDKLRGEII